MPPKARMFIWRLCSGALPTSKGLYRRIKSVSQLCLCCCRNEESELHAISKCNFEASIWDYKGMESFDHTEVSSVLDWWLTKLGVSERAAAAMLAWGIWSEKNSVAHGSLLKHPAKVAAAASLLLAYGQAREVGAGARRSTG